MNAWGGLNNATNQFTPLSLNGAYQERITYDPNGNILTYNRNGDKAGAQQRMDELTYNYKNNNNQLKRVRDAAAAGNYSEDIDDQPADNYDYDAIGNLIKDTKEGITKINWTVYGKIESIEKSDGTTIDYSYDATGNRINKTVTKAGATNTTVYVRDAQGNVLSIYEQNSEVNSGHFTQSELHLYGSSRLGIYNVNKDLTVTSAAPVNMGSGNSGILNNFERNKKLFELTNHLGNVLATVSDEKVGMDADNNGLIDYYTANIVSAQDYYPFGMSMPGRKFTSERYRYGFNGKENDNDITPGAQDYGMRINDNRLGRFLSVDPLTKNYPELTPYQFASNSPIANIDLDGLESLFYIRNKYEFYGYNRKLLSTKEFQIRDKSREVSWIANKLNSLVSGNSKTGTSILLVNTVDRISLEGKITHETKILGELYIPSEGDKTRGGFYFTSKKGGGGANEVGSLTLADNGLISIDILLAAVGVPTGGGEIENIRKFIQIFSDGGKKAAEIIEAAEAMAKGITGAYDAGDKIGESVDKLKGKMWKKGSVYYDKALKHAIKRDTDSSGQYTDEKPTDTLHNDK